MVYDYNFKNYMIDYNGFYIYFTNTQILIECILYLFFMYLSCRNCRWVVAQERLRSHCKVELLRIGQTL